MQSDPTSSSTIKSHAASEEFRTSTRAFSLSFTSLLMNGIPLLENGKKNFNRKSNGAWMLETEKKQKQKQKKQQKKQWQNLPPGVLVLTRNSDSIPVVPPLHWNFPFSIANASVNYTEKQTLESKIFFNTRKRNKEKWISNKIFCKWKVELFCDSRHAIAWWRHSAGQRLGTSAPTTRFRIRAVAHCRRTVEPWKLTGFFRNEILFFLSIFSSGFSLNQFFGT